MGIIFFILFYITLFGSFYIPGSLFLRTLGIKKVLTPFQNWSISWFVGISLFLLMTYGSAYARVPKAYEFVLASTTVVWIVMVIRSRKHYSLKNLQVSLSKLDYLSNGILLSGSVAIALLMFFSGFWTKTGLQFFSVNGVDGIRHLAYITDQITHFPPQEPGVAGQPLQGFHYFYDFMLSRFALFFPFSVSDLYFRYFPFFLAILYGISFVLITHALPSSAKTRRFVLFFAYFARSTVSPLLLFIHSVSLNEDILTQPLALILNPFTVLSIAMLLTGISLLPKIKDSWKFTLVISLLFGVLSEIKVYSGILAVVSLLSYSVYLLVLYKKKYLRNMIFAIAGTGILTLVTFFPNNFGSGGLIFAPFLFFSHYMQTDLFTLWQWQNRLLSYSQEQTFLGYIKSVFLFIIAIIMYGVISFGLRLIIALKVKSLFSKKFWKNEIYFMLFCACVVCVFIPSFFIQSVSVFDTVQFFWILLSLLAIPTGIVFSQYWQKTTHKKLLLTAILLITIPGIYLAENKYLFSADRVTIATADMQVLQQADTNIPKNSFAVLIPQSEDIGKNHPLPVGTPYISAFAQSQVYYEEGWLPTKNASLYNGRAKLIARLQSDAKFCLPYSMNLDIKEIGSPYIITIGNNYPCVASAFHVVQTIESKNSVIHFYKIALQ